MNYYSLFLLNNFKCQLIVCQMSSTRCPTLNWLLLPLFVIVMVVNVGVTPYVESILLFTLTAAFTLAHVHYGVQVVSKLGQNWFIWFLNSGMQVRENFRRSLLIRVSGRILGYSQILRISRYCSRYWLIPDDSGIWNMEYGIWFQYDSIYCFSILNYQ